MTNTSAYANVLLKSPVAAPSVAEPKRDYKNESSADFHKTLKDVNEGLKSQSERIKKSADNKFEQLERQKSIKESKSLKENNALKASNEHAKKMNKADDKAAQNKLTSDPADVKENSAADKTEAHESFNELNQEAVLAVVNPAASNLSTSINLSLDNGSITNPLGSSSAGVNTLSSTMASDIDQAVAINVNAVDSENGGLAGANSIQLSTVNAPGASTDNSAVVSGTQPINTVALANAQALAGSPIPANSSPQPATEVADDAAAILASLTTETSTSAKATSAVSATTLDTAATNTPETTTQLQMQASKTAFEKTLQAAVASEAMSSDDALVASPSSSNSSTHSLMDSLMRGADSHTPSARSFVVQTAIPVPVGQPQWSQAVGEKVLWLAAQNVSSAEINLHPKDLGPMQVKVSVNQEQTTVSFTSPHAVVREVLDQNLNRLRDMFNEQGLNLVNVDVSDKSFSRQHGDAQDQKGQGGSSDVSHEEEKPVAMSAIVQQRLVDHYA